MIKRYEYQGLHFASERDLRKHLYETKRIALGKTHENAVEFWFKYGVAYTEEDEPIEVFKQQKALIVKQAFLNWRNNQATLISSLGFKADSNERANTDVSGLLIAYENNQDALITFRDADNEFHSLTYAQVKTLQCEIIENGNFAYEQKWTFDAQVENATTKEELDSIEVVFVGKNFTKE